MFYTILYFGFSYTVTGALVWAIRHAYRKQYDPVARQWSRRKGIAAFASTALLLFPLLPYLWVEVLTRTYWQSLMPVLLTAAPQIGVDMTDVQIFRVLSVGPESARVYVVQPCRGGMGADRVALTVTFRKTLGKWEFAEYDCPWSDCGSAKGNVFPPYPEGRSF